ncbi:hypothetical protein NKR23_g5132 [Pleurostoma richardsiae]|uniref:Uncharacterized protein n=1 Tax=Pleurostoma richardsiae TaxID=41990 RepID=A0AA38S381_9PEZI|nr:hypothetical protein NKR23_g5132 [Pleurostoma richardsiae]
MDGIVNLASTASERFTRNVSAGLAQMSPEKWIRLVIIVGTYMLLRPYLMKLGAKAQMRAHEKEEEEAAAAAKISPNELRGQKIAAVPEDSDDEEAGEGQPTGADWGKKARRRQREMVKKILDAEERRLQQEQEDEEDKDIEEFLTQ